MFDLYKDVLFNPNDICEPTNLEVGSPKFDHIELTLCVPHTVAFLKALSGKQKVEHLRRYQILTSMNKKIITRDAYCFEYTQKGQIHMHAIWILQLPEKSFSGIGLVSDIAKQWLATLSKKYSQFYESKIYNFDNNTSLIYKDASIKVKLALCQPERAREWETYINKFSLAIVDNGTQKIREQSAEDSSETEDST